MPSNFDDDDFDRDDRRSSRRDDRRSSRRDDRDEGDRYFEPPPQKKSSLLLILGIVGGVLLLCGGGVVVAIILLIFPALQKTREAAARVETTNNMKQLTIGASNYESANGEWVHNRWNRTNTTELLSWRLELFPYIEQENVYNFANRDKAWNDPSNATTMNTNIRTFKHASDPTASNQTYFQAFSGSGAILDPKSPRQGRTKGNERPLSISNIRDGASNTLFIAEASTKVTIIQPSDIPFPSASVPTLGIDPKSKTFLGAFCDGAVRILRKESATAQGLTAWVCPNDGAVVPMD